MFYDMKYKMFNIQIMMMAYMVNGAKKNHDKINTTAYI